MGDIERGSFFKIPRVRSFRSSSPTEVFDDTISSTESGSGERNFPNFGLRESKSPYEVLKGLSNVKISKIDENVGPETQQEPSLRPEIVNRIHRDLIGEYHTFQGPFGPRKCIYMDHTASGRSLRGIESFIMDSVMPSYGNTHSTSNHTSSQITAYREEARKLILKSCGGNPLKDEVIFCGSGSTAAVHKLIGSLISPSMPSPIVILGPFEHHSNILPWREITNGIVTIPENSKGQVDLKFLERILVRLKTRIKTEQRLLIGAFSVGSNVTGALSDDVAITVLLHKYGALSVWDYAAAAPHVPIKMNPKTGDLNLDVTAEKDAIFFSGHKFLGEPQTPGILLAKKHSIFRNSIPHGHGGGTVLFVTRNGHEYLKNAVDRSEGGTPDIIGAIRLGLVFQIQNNIGLNTVVTRETHFTRLALEAWVRVPEIRILGPTEVKRLPIISFMILHPQTDYYLHHDFIVVLLNDLFGIQCRGGCMCAGPYGQNLLGIDDKLAKKYENILKQPRSQPLFLEEPTYDLILKPGFVRISLPYHAPEHYIDYTIRAITFVAQQGWKLLPFYRMAASKGTFRLPESEHNIPQKRLKSFSLNSLGNHKVNIVNLDLKPKRSEDDFEDYLDCARQLVLSAEKIVSSYELDFENEETFEPERADLRWFLMPSEAAKCLSKELQSKRSGVKSPKPFKIKVYENNQSSKSWNVSSIPYIFNSFVP